MNTYGMYELPTLFLVLVARDTAADAALTSVDEIEEVAGKFLFAVFDGSLDVDDSIYIASLNAIAFTPEINSNAVRSLQPAEDKVRYFEIKVRIFLKDGILPESNIEAFTWNTLSEAFQSTEALLSLLRETPTFSSIAKVELTYKMEICPSGVIRCLHGSECSTTSADGNDKCDCSTSLFTVDGMQCEYIATDLCAYGATTLKDSTGANSSSQLSFFCVNGGTCTEKPPCNCPSEYEGPRCERKREGGPPTFQIKNRDTTDESQIVIGLSNTLFWISIGVGGAVILLFALIVGYKIKCGRNETSSEPSDVEILPACRRNGVDGTGRTAPSFEHDTFVENASPLYSQEKRRPAHSPLD